MPLSIVAFDTSAINALAKGGKGSEPQILALQSGFDVRLTAMSVSELIAAPRSETREMLIGCAQRLLGTGCCIWPPHEIIRLLISAYDANPVQFDWTNVDIRARLYERAIIDRQFMDDASSGEELNQQRLLEEEFVSFWERLRPKLDLILSKEPSKRPKNYRQAAEIATSASPNLVCGIAQDLYQYVSGKTPGEGEMAALLDACPPLRALCFGLCGTWYDVALAPVVYKKLPGRNDHLMSVYLAYCHRFVTQDRKQSERLRDIATEAKLNCEVLTYEEFWQGLQIVA